MSRHIVHGTAVAIGDAGVLLLGPSGAGKSDLALRLMDEGAVLIADDRTVVDVVSGRAIASPPPAIAGRIEARGLGIYAVPFREGAPLALCVALGVPPQRLPSAIHTHDIGSVALPLAHIDPRVPSATALVRLALHGSRVSP